MLIAMVAMLAIAAAANAAVIIDASTNHGSFESALDLGDTDDSGDTLGTRVNQVEGWTAVDSNWSMFTHTSYASKSVTDGVYGLSINDGATATVTSDPIAYAVTAGQMMTLTFDMGVNSLTGGVNSDNFTGNIYFDGGAAVTFGTQQVTSTVDLNAGGAYGLGSLYRNVYTSTIAVPADATSLVLDFVAANSSTGSSQAYVDNINLSVVPEPATFGLLGLAFGGLVAMRRRKK